MTSTSSSSLAETCCDETWVKMRKRDGQVFYWNRRSDKLRSAMPAVATIWQGGWSRDGRRYFWKNGGAPVWELPPLSDQAVSPLPAVTSFDAIPEDPFGTSQSNGVVQHKSSGGMLNAPSRAQLKGFTRLARRKSGGCIVPTQPVSESESLAAASGSGARATTVQNLRVEPETTGQPPDRSVAVPSKVQNLKVEPEATGATSSSVGPVPRKASPPLHAAKDLVVLTRIPQTWSDELLREVLQQFTGSPLRSLARPRQGDRSVATCACTDPQHTKELLRFSPFLGFVEAKPAAAEKIVVQRLLSQLPVIDAPATEHKNVLRDDQCEAAPTRRASSVHELVFTIGSWAERDQAVSKIQAAACAEGLALETLDVAGACVRAQDFRGRDVVAEEFDSSLEFPMIFRLRCPLKRPHACIQAADSAEVQEPKRQRRAVLRTADGRGIALGSGQRMLSGGPCAMPVVEARFQP